MPDLPRLAVTRKVLAAMLGLSERKIVELEVTSMIGPTPIRFGRSVRYVVSEISRWLDAGAPDRAEWRRQNGKSVASARLVESYEPTNQGVSCDSPADSVSDGGEAP